MYGAGDVILFGRTESNDFPTTVGALQTNSPGGSDAFISKLVAPDLYWANDGGGAWNATKCEEIPPEPDGVGEPCTVEISGTSGVDTCVLGAMCWDVDPETNEVAESWYNPFTKRRVEVLHVFNEQVNRFYPLGGGLDTAGFTAAVCKRLGP